MGETGKSPNSPKRNDMTEQNNAEIQQLIKVTRAVRTDAGAIYCLVEKGPIQLWISQTDMVLKKQEVLGELAKRQKR
jgi:hypothetical protein